MNFEELFPIWNKLTHGQQEKLLRTIQKKEIKLGSELRTGEKACMGMVLVEQGLLRAYMVSEIGREITLYHLMDRDICLFSASCAIKGLEVSVSVSALRDTSVYVIPVGIYQELTQESTVFSNYMSEILAQRMSEVMWLMEQVLFHGFDSRLADFLLEHAGRLSCETCHITQDEIARNLGTAREVVTRMLKHFQTEGLVEVFRGGIRILDRVGLSQLAQKEK